VNTQLDAAESHFSAISRTIHGLPQSTFESLVFQLSPQEERLFRYLREHGIANTISIRTDCAIGNVSQAACLLNVKLASVGLRVVCEERPNRNRFGQRGVLGWWFIVDRAEESDASVDQSHGAGGL